MNWDDAKYFLAIAREGQMLGAAARLRVSQAKLSRRVASLETALGTKLLVRRTNGCELTPDGAALLAVAERVEAEFLEAQSKIRHTESDLTGTVRIGAPDGFGVGFLAPRLGRLMDQHPGLNVQLVPVPRSFSLSQREADIAVMIGRPTKGRLRARKLSEYSLGLYASRGYLKAAGHPKTAAELRSHTLIGYVEDLIYTAELNYTAEVSREWASRIEISSAMGQFEAVRSGAGIGILHDYMATGDRNLVLLLPEHRLMRSYWTVWHETMKGAKRITAVADFLDEQVREGREAFVRA